MSHFQTDIDFWEQHKEPFLPNPTQLPSDCIAQLWDRENITLSLPLKVSTEVCVYARRLCVVKQIV